MVIQLWEKGTKRHTFIVWACKMPWILCSMPSAYDSLFNCRLKFWNLNFIFRNFYSLLLNKINSKEFLIIFCILFDRLLPLCTFHTLINSKTKHLTRFCFHFIFLFLYPLHDSTTDEKRWIEIIKKYRFTRNDSKWAQLPLNTERLCKRQRWRYLYDETWI